MSTEQQAQTSEFIEEGRWGKDHWSLLAYIEHVMVDCAGFQVGLDAHMRQGRRHYRVMREECPHPKRRHGHSPVDRAMAMEPEHGTRLKGGVVLPWHDDWSCVQDLAHAGYFTCTADEVQPGAVLHFSDKGMGIAAKLRQHKSAGGGFGTFSAA